MAFRGLKAGEPDIERAVAVARDLSDGGGNASLIGLPWRTTVADAVFVNCQMMRAFGRDDVIFETGFLETFLGSAEFDQDALLAGLGRDYAIMTSEEKHYPGTGLNQVPIELMRGFVLNDRIGAGDVESIHVTFPAERKNFRASYARGPFTPRTSPSSALFQFGALLVDGELRPDRYEDVDHPDIRRLIDNSRLDFVDGKSVRYARLEVATRDGRVLVGEGDEFTCEPESPEAILTREAHGILAKEKIEGACKLIGGLQNVGDVAELTACLVP